MSAAFPIYPAHTAVLSMDCQTGIVSIYTRDDKDAFLARVASALNHARASGMTVIHVQVGFRPGLPEVSTRNLLFGAIKSSTQRQKLFEEPLGAIPTPIEKDKMLPRVEDLNSKEREYIVVSMTPRGDNTADASPTMPNHVQ